MTMEKYLPNRASHGFTGYNSGILTLRSDGRCSVKMERPHERFTGFILDLKRM